MKGISEEEEEEECVSIQYSMSLSLVASTMMVAFGRQRLSVSKNVNDVFFSAATRRRGASSQRRRLLKKKKSFVSSSLYRAVNKSRCDDDDDDDFSSRGDSNGSSKVVAAYRALPLDRHRRWSDPSSSKLSSSHSIEGRYVSSETAKKRVERAVMGASRSCASLEDYARRIVYETKCIESKIALTHEAFSRCLRGDIDVETTTTTKEKEEEGKEQQQLPSRPARPDRPNLVDPRAVPSPKKTPLSSHSAHVMHTVAHIELNAIDLAWDTVARFRGLPKAFYLDFARVADDESRHLSWCLQRLEELGHEYGDMDAHDMLWLGCFESRGDKLDRMCVVPMAQEARGLDAGPRLREKLVGRGDNRSAAIVERITKEELNHVAVGVHWFREMCAREENIERGNEEELGKRFLSAVERCAPDVLRGPFAHEEREKAGMAREWYDLSFNRELHSRLEMMVKMEEANSSE